MVVVVVVCVCEGGGGGGGGGGRRREGWMREREWRRGGIERDGRGGGSQQFGSMPHHLLTRHLYQ